MHPVLTPLLAAADPVQAGRPLFGHLGLALAAVLAGIAALLVLVTLLGRWLAATHPAPPPHAEPPVHVTVAPQISSDPQIGPGVSPALVPVFVAAAAQLLGVRARVVSIRIAAPAPVVAVPSLEALMQQWSYEGRRQIYSSHKVR